MNTTLYQLLGELMATEAKIEADRAQLLESEEQHGQLTMLAAKLMRPFDEHTVWDGPDDSRWHLDGDRVIRDPRGDSRDVVLPPVEAEEEEDFGPDMGFAGPSSIGVAPAPIGPAAVFPALRLDSHGYYRDGRDGKATELNARARAGGAEITGAMT